MLFSVIKIIFVALIHGKSNRMKNLLLTFLLGFISLTSAAQQSYEWEALFEELYANNDENTDAKEQTFELLADLSEHPLNLNTASREELERIPFLTAEQIEDIQAYVYQYHGMQSLGELAMIESLDALRRQLLPYFVSVSPIDEQRQFPTLSSIVKGGKQTLLFTAYLPFYQRAGDRNGYLGYPYTHSFRYSFRYADYVQAGLVGAQDAGEPFFAHRNSLGYDHYSFYLLLRKMGRLKSLVVGRYKVNFGQGLVINNSFGFGKLAILSTLGRQSVGVHAHSSRSPVNYLQGGAATIELAKHIDITAFLSYRSIDAGLTESGTIKTILRTGYHRTEREMRGKDAATQFAGGTHLAWSSGAYRMGLTAIYSCFNKDLTPNTSLYYRKYAPSGNNFWNIGADYSYQHPRWSLVGEAALDNKGSVAMMNNLTCQPTSNLSLLAVQRYYSYQYTALFARGLTNNGTVQNESGILVGANWNVKRGLSLMAYTDFAYFSHPRFGAHIASKTWDNLIMLTYSRRRWTVLTRYRVRISEKDNTNKTTLVNELTQRGRFSLAYSATSWSCKSQLDIATNNYLKSSFGYMFCESGTWKPLSWLMINASIGYFHTADFASRIYVYERGPLYSFSFPAFFGRGMRYSFFARADLSNHLMCILRSSTTHFFDRNQISSGLQKVHSSTLSGLDIQLRWRF